MSKILVVEDDELNWDLISRFLQRSGYEMVHASSGIQAISAAEAHKPDLILMDLGLPEMDGWEATRRIKERPSTRGIPVIAFTAHSSTSDLERAIAVGCDHYETKPIKYHRLLEKIESILRTRAPA